VYSDKVAELQRLFTQQEKELLQSLATIRKQMSIINGDTSLFRLFINNYTKDPIYYAHLYDDNGRQTDARMSCKTTDKEKATLYAIEHREAFLDEYFDKKNKEDFYKLLTEYYTEKSELFRKAAQKRKLRQKQIIKYKGFVNNYFIPFLKIHKITSIRNANNKRIIEDFQFYCKDVKQNGKYALSVKTINDNMQGAIAPIFNQILEEKSFFALKLYENLKEEEGEKKSIGLIPIRTTFSILLNDFFWQKENDNTNKIPFLVNKVKTINKYRLYCLLGNLCGLRNAEILLLRKENIKLIGKTYFLSIENSRTDGTGTKTMAGKRLVPLHPFIYTKLDEYIKENNRTDYIFWAGSKTINYNDFARARTIFSLLCGYDESSIKGHNIVFYSFRHFFNTIITNALYEIDLVEYYMGHSNRSDMKKNYLHLGSVGNKYIEENGIKIISVIENYFSELFKKKMDNLNGNEEKKYLITLQKPVVKEVVYFDISHQEGRKRLVWTIPDPENIEDIYDYDDEEDTQEEKSLVEQFNEHNSIK
jgi:integrase